VYICGASALVLSFGFLAVLLVDVFRDGWSALSWNFFTEFPSRFPAKAGILSALMGTLWIIALTGLFAVPIGIATAIFLEEMAPRGLVTRLIRLNIHNLSGIPAIVYGMLGLGLFVRAFELGRSIWAGAATMALMILPIIIIATAEAIRSVPDSIRWAAFGVGASKSQVVLSHVLPEAFPGIMTGIILSLSRAVGEAAPLILIGALSFVAFVPHSPSSPFTVLAIQIFNWAGRPEDEFRVLAAGGIIVLLAVTLSMNALAIYLRARTARA